MNTVDEYLRGPTLRLPRQLAARRLGTSLEQWQAGFDEFLAIVVSEDAFDSTSLAKSGSSLAILLQSPLPPDLQAEPIGIPSAFRRLDLAHFDVLALGQNFVTRLPDRFQPILLLGLRTAGSYFAPLLRAFLKAEAYGTVSSLTVQPNKGPHGRT